MPFLLSRLVELILGFFAEVCLNTCLQIDIPLFSVSFALCSAVFWSNIVFGCSIVYRDIQVRENSIRELANYGF